MSLTKIPPYHYIHILDTNTNICRTITGPSTFLPKEHEKITLQPTKMHMIPRNFYAIIENPVIKDKTGKIVMDDYNQAKLKRGQKEIRFEQDPFPLYPGETMLGDFKQLEILVNGEAFVIKALFDFYCDLHKVERKAGDEWLFSGPATYVPRIEEKIIEKRSSIIVKPHQALKLKAKNEFVDKVFKVNRKTGDEWLMDKEGPYILDAYEKLLETVDPVVLDFKTAVIIKANQKFNDNGVERKKNEMWLLTDEDTTLYIPPPSVTIEKVVPLTVLTHREFCILSNPMNEQGVSQIGDKKLIKGPAKFFTKPMESVSRIEEIRVLSPEDSIYCAVNEDFEEMVPGIGNAMRSIKRKAGTRYTVYGPREFIPPIQVTEIKRQKAVFAFEPLELYIFNPFYLFLLFILGIYLLKCLLYGF
ncbi:hypothetical protein DLAC_07332 [Tieghemostelium lacteum]|uniref:Major vault protein n=1 Tax=Tieghemostelium lacteum TaxID=361077 RepID=A0A151ZCB0_TIELA|nr:hypothetical protein DLAC_07332 [Tieghemostelium lacteum]|eukprot:KYQ91565.1 hypothetical protein DLAC_07332 [Tieghemostelium lacteum]